MRDYVELVKTLRYCADRPICFSTQCDYRQTAHIGACFDSLKHDAADAIEELRDAFCLLCGTCTSPPSDETFYACEIARRCLPEPPKEVE